MFAQPWEGIIKFRDGPEVDVLTIRLDAAPEFESDKAKPGVILDASKRVDSPHAVEFLLAA